MLSSLFSILSSRVLGFFREVLTAYYFGASVQTDAFFLAWKIPNIFRRVLAEGALEKIFLPLLKEGFDENFVRSVFFWLFVSSLGVSFAVFLSADWLISLISSKGVGLGADLLRYLIFYLPFAVVSAYFSALFQYRKHFFFAYFSSALFNLTAIVFLLLFAEYWGIWALVWGVLFGGLVQLLFSLALGLKFKVLFPPKAGIDFKVKKFFKNLLPSVGSMGVGQLSTLAEAFFAMHAGGGVLSSLYYAFRLLQLPVSVIGVSVSRVGLSFLTDAGGIYSKNPRELEFTLKRNLLRGAEIALFFAIPAVLGLLTLAEPIVNLVYQRGAFDLSDTRRVALYLQIYSLGLPPSVLYPLVANVFYIKERFYLGFFLSTVWLLTELTVPSIGLFVFNLGGWIIAFAYTLGAWFTFFTFVWASNSSGIFLRSLWRLRALFPLWAFTAAALLLPFWENPFLLILCVFFFALLYLYLFKKRYLTRKRVKR